MWGELDRCSRVLADATLAETVFLSFAVLLMLFCQQPARRIVVAKAAILLSTLMIPLVAFSPLPRFHPRSWFTAQANQVSGSGLARAAISRSPAANPAPSIDPRQVAGGLFRQGSAWANIEIGRMLTLGYLAGVLVGLIWFLLGFWAFARVIGQSREASPELRTLYDHLVCHAQEPRAAPGLRVSARVHRPVLAGLIRPFILIPPEYDQGEFDCQSLQAILTHELAHAAHDDSRFSAAASLAQSLWFFLPFLWWLRVQMRTDQEFLADRRTAMMAGSAANYATRLVSLAARKSRTLIRRPVIDSVPMLSADWRAGGFKSQLLQRVVMLLHCPFEVELRPPRLWSLSLSLLLAGLALGCSAVSLSSPAATGTSVTHTPARVGKLQFRVAEFVAVPQVVSRSGRSTVYQLPLALPRRWELDVEIHATPSTLRRIRIVGLMMAPEDEPGVPSYEDPRLVRSSLSWHQVQILHDERRTEIKIDGDARALNPGQESLSEWLTIEPAADETAVLRNLIVTW